MGVEALARPEIVEMKAYSSARKEAPGEGILLNANEAPHALLPDEEMLNRYPDPQPARLLSRLAWLYGVGEENLLVTRGSDEGIDLLTRVFCRAGQDAILQCPPNFGMYKIAAQTQGAEVISVPRKVDSAFELDHKVVLQTVAMNNHIKLVFLTSPNNPTGDVIEFDFLSRLLNETRGKAIVVLDEAYAEFSRLPSAATLIKDHENLVVLRTLSKAWASAGLRCGAVLAQPALISLLRRVIAPYPLPSPVIALALRMLEDDVLARQKLLLEEITSNKLTLLNKLKQFSFMLEIIPGEANFVLIRVNNSDELLTFCANQGVIVRGFPADPLLKDYIRISIGSEGDLNMLTTIFEEWEHIK